jgi:hypothetical protein
METPMTTYRALTDEALANVYSTGTQAEQDAVLAEMARRDRRDARTAVDQGRWAKTKQEWLLAAQAAYEVAEAATNGYMLSKEGQAAGIDPFDLWAGSAAQANRYASEELLGHWETHPRLTVSAYREQMRRDKRAF